MPTWPWRRRCASESDVRVFADLRVIKFSRREGKSGRVVEADSGRPLEFSTAAAAGRDLASGFPPLVLVNPAGAPGNDTKPFGLTPDPVTLVSDFKVWPDRVEEGRKP